ncbi:MAG: ABC transporter permease [Euryarchaeota archaeon]|nr:ABC transporter permease [Euryarchaeota archaeon]
MIQISRLFAVTKKELRAIRAEKTIILAILLQIFIAMFSSFLMVGLSAMYNPDMYKGISGIQYAVGYVDAGLYYESDLSEAYSDLYAEGVELDFSLSNQRLYDLIEQDREFVPYHLDLETALASLQERKLAAVVYVPEPDPTGVSALFLTLYTIQNDLQSTVIEAKMQDLFMQYERELREFRSERLDSVPLPLDMGRLRGGDFYEFLYLLLIPLLLFMPAIISAGLVVDLMTEEFSYKTLDILKTTPLTMSEAIWGKIAACILIIPIQSAAWLILLAFNQIFVAYPLLLLLHVTLISSILIVIAAFLGLYYKDRSSAQLVFSAFAVVLLMLALTLPYNPIHLAGMLSAGRFHSFYFLLIAGEFIFFLLLSGVFTRFIGRFTDDLP